MTMDGGDQPTGDEPATGDGEAGTAGAGNARAWWIGGGIVAVVAAIVIVVLVVGGDDDADDAASTTDVTEISGPETTVPETTVPETTAPATTAPATTAPPATTEPPPASTEPPPATTEPPPETTEPPSETDGTIPDGTAGSQLFPNPGTDDITAGDVFAYWYRNPASGNYIALYTGEGIAGAAGQGLCPGNSILTDTFENVSNAPSEEGACDGFPTDVGSVQVCDGGVWIYETLISSDLEGTLFGSLEWNTDAGIAGLSSQTESAPDLPEFESGLATYSIGAMMTVDGSTEITCADALT